MQSHNLNSTLILILLCAAALFWSCSKDDSSTNPVGPDPTEELTADCIGCHTNEAMLRATAIPDEEPSGDPSGEG
ncbi:hypothetical protein KKC97_08730 [bacterium]|nr:hypothetical protein [bacterium]MBU1637733.1 hypothetical protein [bacterium]MBU1920318.1 hypothetical protein [bacterium]